MKKKIILAVIAGAAMLLPIACTNQAPAPESGAATLDELFATRRSIRSYDASKTISAEEVRTLLTAAQQAPSWANTQTSRYYVAVSPEKVAAAKECIGERNAQNVAGAPVIIVSTFVKGQSGFGRGQAVNEVGEGWGAYDNGLSNAYLILKAREMGFDTLIMGFRESDRLRALFAIPEGEEVMAVIALGYRAGEPNQPRHKSLDEIAKFF
ncbi:MAG: nitroreductase family protein [Bacteroidales bacterium]|nr:nitroreductase family protein [Bacteroidales bacterium]